MDGGRARCTSDRECDDGLFCSGAESCDPTSLAADERGCIARPPCGTSESCDEASGRCVLMGCEIADRDGDGARSIACGGADCDDDDANRYPGATEVCDVDDRDEDCDPSTFGFRDIDRDDHPDSACCNVEGDVSACGDDCNDMAASVYAGAPDICDGRDNDCDGTTDEEGGTLYLDCDGDGFGNSMVSRMGCPTRVEAGPDCPSPVPSSTWVTIPGDCDDRRVSTFPGAAEECNGIDDDCMLPVDPPRCACTDGAMTECGFDAACRRVMGTCRAGAFDCPPGLRTGGEPEICDGVDNQCNGVVDEGCPCSPVGSSRPCSTTRVGACGVGSESCTATGYAGCPMPGVEMCSPVDEDCDGMNDEQLHVWQLSLSVSGTETCDRVHAAHTCARNISMACRSASPPSGRCASVGGYGAVEYGADSMTVICISDLVRMTGVAASTLSATGFTCNADDANFGACRAAIHRYCASMGHASGFGYPDAFVGTFTVNCITTAVGQSFLRPWADIAAVQPMCRGPSPDTIYCPNGVHRYCQSRGFASGWGPVEHNSSVIGFVCIRNY